MEFTTTGKGQRKLILTGYIYVFQKNLVNDITSWVWCEFQYFNTSEGIHLNQREGVT